MKNTKKDQRISLVRVLAMLSIILCHIVSEFNSIKFMGQILNVGVFTFIFISGFLYGKKNIDNIGNWLTKRAVRILVPMYVFMIILFTVRIILLNQLDFKYYLIYFFNLQGLLGGVLGAGHLWFLTAIMICYLVTPILNNLRSKIIYLTKTKLIIGLFILVGVQILASYFINKTLGRYLCYVNLYIFGYFIRSVWKGNISKKGLIISTMLTMVAILIRFGMKFVVDDTIFYENIIVLYTQCVFGVWIFIFVTYFKNIANNNIIIKVVNNLEKISFEIFIVHYMFIVGPVRVMFLTRYSLINIVIVLGLSYVTGVILHKICDLIYNMNFLSKIIDSK